MKTLNENSKVSLSIAFTVLAAVAGASWQASSWVTTIRSDISEGVTEISSLKQGVGGVTSRLDRVESQLLQIRSMLRAQNGLPNRPANTALSPESLPGFPSKVAARLK